MKRQKIIDLIITFVVWFIVAMPIHEFWHYQVGSWLGGKGFYITYPNFLSGLCSWADPPSHIWAVCIAGGLGTAIIMFLLTWRALLSPTKWDEDEVFSLAVLGGLQVGYGLSELSLLYAPGGFDYIAPICSLLGALPFMIWRGPKMADWIMKEEV